MKSSVFAAWVIRKPFHSYVLTPAGFSLVLIALYFCGVFAAQSLVAPTPEGAAAYSWREFGALEILQYFILLSLMFYLVRCLRLADTLSVLLLLVALAGLVTFVFLEEIDYGAQLLNVFSGRPPNLSPGAFDRNVHAMTLTSGEQVAGYLKLAGNILVLLVFVIVPLMLGDSRNRTARLVVPSRWVIATVIVAIAVYWLAHNLDARGFGIINDVQGNLHLDLSEFSETCIYYLFLVYVAVLHERLIHRKA